jgi:hypothetical protein
VDATGYNVEYAVAISERQNMSVEVKSPGWEAELTEAQRLAGRASQPKYLAGVIEGGAAGPVQVIRRTVDKARPKFSGNYPSLVVLSDDCRLNLGEWGWGPLQMALCQEALGGYGRGLFRDLDFAVVGAVCLFWAVSILGQRGVEYRCLCTANPKALSTAAVPKEVLTRLTTKQSEPPPISQKLQPNFEV